MTIFLIHGFDHDPSASEHSPLRAGGQYPIWMEQLKGCAPFPFLWYSGRVSHFWRAWKAGHYNPYRWAYDDLAPAAADDLIKEIEGSSTDPVDALCHSLGTRATLLAAKKRPDLFRRIILLNGAQAKEEAVQIIKASSGIEFLNIAVKTDDVLKRLGARFAPGFGRDEMIGRHRISSHNCTTIILDNKKDKSYWLNRGIHIKGDNPKKWSDHSYSFLWAENWKIYRLFLNNGLGAL